tara:strand:- start:120 stop:308 length:189 start_codon:yes stop_codon:yes gene_type:complete
MDCQIEFEETPTKLQESAHEVNITQKLISETLQRYGHGFAFDLSNGSNQIKSQCVDGEDNDS